MLHTDPGAVPSERGCSIRERLFRQREAVPSERGCSVRGRLFHQREAVPSERGCSIRERLFHQREDVFISKPQCKCLVRVQAQM